MNITEINSNIDNVYLNLISNAQAHIIETLHISEIPTDLIKKYNPEPLLTQLHTELVQDMLLLLDTCFLLRKEESKPYLSTIILDILFTIDYSDRVEILIVNLISFVNYKFLARCKGLTQEYNKFYKQEIRKLKQCYKEYKKQFLKIKKTHDKINEKIRENEQRKQVNTHNFNMNMNTVFSEIVENTYTNISTNDPSKLCELVESVGVPEGVTPQEHMDTVKEVLLNKL